MGKEDKKGIFGNLTCVMAKMGALNGQLDIKMSYFTDKVWDGFADGEEPESEFNKKLLKATKIATLCPEKFLKKFWIAKDQCINNLEDKKCFSNVQKNMRRNYV